MNLRCEGEGAGKTHKSDISLSVACVLLHGTSPFFGLQFFLVLMATATLKKYVKPLLIANAWCCYLLVWRSHILSVEGLDAAVS